jgi:hypothetical protein
VLTTFVAVLGSSLRAIDAGSIWVTSWELRLRGGVLSGRTAVVVNLGIVAFVAVLTSDVSSLGCSLRAIGESSIWIATWQVRRFVTLSLLSGVVPVMLVTVLATLVICLSSSLGALSESAVGVAAVALEVFHSSLFGGSRGLESE